MSTSIEETVYEQDPFWAFLWGHAKVTYTHELQPGDRVIGVGGIESVEGLRVWTISKIHLSWELLEMEEGTFIVFGDRAVWYRLHEDVHADELCAELAFRLVEKYMSPGVRERLLQKMLKPTKERLEAIKAFVTDQMKHVLDTNIVGDTRPIVAAGLADAEGFVVIGEELTQAAVEGVNKILPGLDDSIRTESVDPFYVSVELDAQAAAADPLKAVRACTDLLEARLRGECESRGLLTILEAQAEAWELSHEGGRGWVVTVLGLRRAS